MLKRICYFVLGSIAVTIPFVIAHEFGWELEGFPRFIPGIISTLGGIAAVAVAEKRNKVLTLDELYRPQTLFSGERRR